MRELNGWIDGTRRRLACGAFLQHAAGLLSGAFFAFGTAVLLVKLWQPALWPHVAWTGLLVVPAVVVAWRLAARERFTRTEAAAILDRNLKAGGLVMSLAESTDGQWATALPRDAWTWAEALPRVRPVRFFKMLWVPLLFAGFACLVPLRAEQAAGPQRPLRQRAVAELEQQLAELRDAGAVKPEDAAKLKQEIAKLGEQAAGSPLTREQWETVDELRTRMQNRADEAARTAAKGRDAAASLADNAGKTDGKQLSPERTAQLKRDVTAAVKKLLAERRQDGTSAAPQQPGNVKLPESIPAPVQQLVQRMLLDGEFKLPDDPAVQRMLMTQLGQFLGDEAARLGQLRNRLQGDLGARPQTTPGQIAQTQMNGSHGNGQSTNPNPGETGTGSGNGSATPKRRSQASFRDVVLPPGILEKPRNDPSSYKVKAPNVQPAAAAPRNPHRFTDPAYGKETWKRPLRPRHRGVVSRYLNADEK